jgi:hypothetical protein
MVPQTSFHCSFVRDRSCNHVFISEMNRTEEIYPIVQC